MKKSHWAIRFFLLLLSTFVVVTFDFLTLAFQPTLSQAILNFLVIALVNSILLALAVSRSILSGWRLFVVIFMAYYALTGFLVGIETVYLPEQLPLNLAVRVLANSAIAAAILSGVSVYLFGCSHPVKQSVRLMEIGWLSWVGKLTLSGIVWMLLFVLVGMFVFQPLAKTLDEAAAIQYLAEFSGNQEDGLRILFFQIGRGMVWALLLIPWLRSVRDKRWQVVLLSGCVCAGWLSSTFFVPTGLPAAIQISHITEMVTENFLYGAWLGFLFYPQQRSVGVQS